MNEIGGYLEMEHFHGDILHGNAIALNCGRNALAYIILAKKIKRMSEESLEYHYVNDLLPLPCDQRYGLEEMDYICDLVEQATD